MFFGWKVWTFCLFAAPFAARAEDGGEVNYYEKIKPIFSIHCYKCHSAETVKSGLRLDRLERALAGGESGNPAVVPGKRAQGELYRRITSTNADEQMPPKGPRLTGEEGGLSERCVDRGTRAPARG